MVRKPDCLLIHHPARRGVLDDDHGFYRLPVAQGAC